MPVRPLAIGLALLCCALAIWLIVNIVRRRRPRAIIWRGIVVLCLLGIIVALVPIVFDLNGPRYFFNHAALVSGGAVVYTILAGNGPPIIVAVNASNGMPGWQRLLPGRLELQTLAGDTLYVVTATNGGPLLQAIRTTYGTELWRVLFSGSGFGAPPIVANGTVFLARSGLDTSLDEHLFAIRAADGQQLWDADIGPANPASLVTVIAGASLIYSLIPDADYSSGVQALRVPDGKSVWSFEDHTSDRDTLAVGESAVYLAETHGVLAALDAHTGAARWNRSFCSRLVAYCSRRGWRRSLSLC